MSFVQYFAISAMLAPVAMLITALILRGISSERRLPQQDITTVVMLGAALVIMQPMRDLAADFHFEILFQIIPVSGGIVALVRASKRRDTATDRWFRTARGVLIGAIISGTLGFFLSMLLSWAFGAHSNWQF